jgi:hypothetical protein
MTETLTQLVKVGPNQVEAARGVFLIGDTAHINEIHGTMAVYLRLKGIVPPSTARTSKPRSQ